MDRIQLIPEYGEVERLLFSFVHEFYNTRFGYGRVIAEICDCLKEVVEIEAFCATDDSPHLEEEFAAVGLSSSTVRITHPGPPEGALNTFMPVFGSIGGRLQGLTFPYLPEDTEYRPASKACEEFARRFLAERGIPEVRLPFEFGTARIAANSEIALVSSVHASNMHWFDQHMEQRCYSVPFIEDEPTKDLDVFLIPVADSTWLVSDFPESTAAHIAMRQTVDVLTAAHQEIDHLPGLKSIRRDDVNCLPNYANALLVNGHAIVPQFGVAEDEIALAVYRNHGFTAHGIDACQVVESNAIFHCMSKTLGNPQD